GGFIPGCWRLSKSGWGAAYQGRKPKSEGRKKTEIRNPNAPDNLVTPQVQKWPPERAGAGQTQPAILSAVQPAAWASRTSDFGLPSAFEFQPSDLGQGRVLSCACSFEHCQALLDLPDLQHMEAPWLVAQRAGIEGLLRPGLHDDQHQDRHPEPQELL